ncbi:hypothetical protein D3C84_579840 [compost metagenome]
MNPGENRFGIEQQDIRLELVDIADAVAGVDHTEAPVEFHLELVNPAGHMGAEFLQEQIPCGERFIHALALGDVDADRQVPDPQTLLVEHRGRQHVHRQMAAIATYQRPLPRLVTALLAALDQHRLAGRNRFAITCTQLGRTRGKFPGQVQVFQGHVPHHFHA